MNPVDLRLRDLRRLVRDMWNDPRCYGIASAALDAALDAAVGANAKSCDRAVIAGYLDHFPKHHPAFDRFTYAGALAANRRDWPWRERGARWRLWDSDAGPARLANALLESGEPALLLREAGLDGDLAEGAFVAEALEHACGQAGEAKGARAVALGERLIALFSALSVRPFNAALVGPVGRPRGFLARLSRRRGRQRRLVRLWSPGRAIGWHARERGVPAIWSRRRRSGPKP